MKKPDLPEDEKKRLASLHSLNILDTSAEERFDRLTRLAKRMFNVPIALVSLVDENRQWFKSAEGLDATETPRDISFCGHAILGNDIFLVTDASKDERFSDNPLVIKDPNIRFYAGCPLKSLDGSKLGTLCIIDRNSRELTEEDIAALKDLAELAERELAAVQLATLDDLTKISNRRGFVILAQNSLNVCARQNIPASLVFLDLDGFKQINDKFGHAEGDRALIAFADLMKKTFRDSDVFGRLGGDEFVVFLTKASTELVEQILERFRIALVDYNRKANRGYNISFSEGVVTVNPEQERSIEALLSRADTLMYEDKAERSELIFS